MNIIIFNLSQINVDNGYFIDNIIIYDLPINIGNHNHI